MDAEGFIIGEFSPPINGVVIERIAPVLDNLLNKHRDADSPIYYSTPETVYWIDANYSQPGYGYINAPSVVTADPPDQDIGEVLSVLLSNTPVGYQNNIAYPLSIATSPVSGGTARAELIFTNNVGKINLLYSGVVS